MPVSVTMPRLGESVTEGTVTRWLKAEGEHVEVDEPLLEVSTDKVDTEIPSPASGVLASIKVAEEIAGLNPAPIDETGIPRVTYCDPEVASMGLTEKAAREKYGADGISSYSYNLGGNGKSQILRTQGFVKLVRLNDGPVLGVHMIGARMSEQVGEAQLIYNWEALPAEVAQLIHAHPTQSEALGEAHLALAGKPLHSHD